MNEPTRFFNIEYVFLRTYSYVFYFATVFVLIYPKGDPHTAKTFLKSSRLFVKFECLSS